MYKTRINMRHRAPDPGRVRRVVEPLRAPSTTPREMGSSWEKPKRGRGGLGTHQSITLVEPFTACSRSRGVSLGGHLVHRSKKVNL
jgi:hypothetical protein